MTTHLLFLIFLMMKTRHAIISSNRECLLYYILLLPVRFQGDQDLKYTIQDTGSIHCYVKILMCTRFGHGVASPGRLFTCIDRVLFVFLKALAALGWGLLSRFPPFRYFPDISTSPKYMLAIEYHVHFGQVLPQLSCGDTCQIWIWSRECNKYFCEIENFAYGEIDERSLSNTTSGGSSAWRPHTCMSSGHAWPR